MNNSQIEIREAVEEDMEVLSNLISRIFEEYEMEFIASDEIPDLLNFKDYYLNNEPVLLVAEKDTQIIGCAALKVDSSGGVYFSRVYVDANYRGEKVGFRLMIKLLKHAQQLNPTSVYLWTDTRFERAHRFYKNLGFTYTGHIRPLHDVNESFEYHYRLEYPLSQLLNELTS